MYMCNKTDHYSGTYANHKYENNHPLVILSLRQVKVHGARNKFQLGRYCYITPCHLQDQFGQ